MFRFNETCLLSLLKNKWGKNLKLYFLMMLLNF